LRQFVAGEGLDLITFETGRRKDDVTQEYLRKFKKSEGVVYDGKAQEKARVMRAEVRAGLAVVSPEAANADLPVARSIRAAETALNTWYDQQKIAA
jgi:hypothetical protein